eukprot:3834358-Pyramimonas_sp.AAC.1
MQCQSCGGCVRARACVRVRTVWHVRACSHFRQGTRTRTRQWRQRCARAAPKVRGAAPKVRMRTTGTWWG